MQVDEVRVQECKIPSELRAACIEGRFNDVNDLLYSLGDVDGTKLLQLLVDEQCSLPVWKVVLKFGIDANVFLKDGTTPLYCSCIKGNEELLMLLLQFNASIKKRNSRDGNSPLHGCVLSANLQLASCLLKYGTVTDVCNAEGSTPVFLAAEHGNDAICRLLLEAEQYKSINATHNVTGATLLHTACSRGHYAIVKLLLERKADVSKRQKESENTPLHIAAFLGNIDICKMLLFHGASVNVCSKNGHSPLHVAAFKGFLDLIKLFLDVGADPNSRTKDGLLPWECATNQDVIDLLRKRDNDTPLKVAASAPIMGFVIPRKTKERKRVVRDRSISSPWIHKPKNTQKHSKQNSSNNNNNNNSQNN